jgi:hypothetical protein
MSKAGDALLQLIRKAIERRTWTVLPTDVVIVAASMEFRQGIDPGVLGAALVAKKAAERLAPPPPLLSLSKASEGSVLSTPSTLSTKKERNSPHWLVPLGAGLVLSAFTGGALFSLFCDLKPRPSFSFVSKAFYGQVAFQVGLGALLCWRGTCGPPE